VISKYFLTVYREIQVSLKSDKNSRHSTRRPMYIYDNSDDFFVKMRNVSDENCIKNKNTHFLFNSFFGNKIQIKGI